MKFQFSSSTISVTHRDAASLLQAVRLRLTRAEGFALATLNVDHLVKLSSDPTFLAAYGQQDLVVADGNPVVWLSRLAGRAVELVPGADMVIPLSREAAAADVPVALVGSTLPVLEAAAARLKEEVPGLQVALCLAPPFGFDPESAAAGAVLTQVRDSGARLCFLALGAPKQERLAARGREIAPEVGFASVGAGLDFLSGTQVRAPLWVRRFAMEWLWRALSSPRRLVPRYVACFRILPGEIRNALRLRNQTPVTYTQSARPVGDAAGSADSSRLPALRQTCQER